jgi:hypothetical protein
VLVKFVDRAAASLAMKMSEIEELRMLFGQTSIDLWACAFSALSIAFHGTVASISHSISLGRAVNTNEPAFNTG